MSELSTKQVVLITGASSGIGQSCAKYLSQQGYQVYGTSRHVEAQPENFKLIPMDVHDDVAVIAGIRHILEQEGQLDILINNAGYGIAGAVEDTNLAELKQQFETNFFGMVRVCQAALPAMRAQHSGLIINISSIAGLISVPFQGAYSASKYAVEGLTEALRMEVKPFGIKVVQVEPGDFHTGFTSHRVRTQQSQTDSPYAQRTEQALAVMEHDETHGHAPTEIARLIHKIIDTPSPKPRYAVGPLMERLAIHLRKFLPQKLFEWIIMDTYKI